MSEQSVLVKLKVEADGGNTRVLQNTRREVQKLNQELEGLITKGRAPAKAVDNLTRQNDAVQGLTERYKKLKDVQSGGESEHILRGKRAQEETRRQSDLLKKQKDEYSKLRGEVHSHSEAASSSAVRVSQGILDVSQGMIQLGIASEENLEAMARKLIYVDGLFRTMKGGVDIVFGLANAWKAADRALKAYAATQAVVDVVGGGGGKSIAGRAVKGAAGRRAAGAVAGGVLTAGAQAGVSGLAGKGTIAAGTATAGQGLKMIGTVAGSVVGKLAGLAAIALVVHDAFKEITYATGLTKSGGLIREGVNYKQAADDAAESEKITGKVTDRLNNQRAKHNAREQVVAQAYTQRRERRDRAVAQFQQFNESIAPDADVANAREKKAAQTELNNAILHFQEVREKNQERMANNQRASHAAELQANLDIQNAIERVREAERGRLNIIDEQIAKQRTVRGEIQQQIEAAEKLVTQQTTSVEGKQAQFAKLSPTEQARLTQLAGKKERGEKFTKSEALFLEQTGYGKDDSRKTLAGIGVDAGANRVLDAFGERDELAEAEKKLAGLNSKKFEEGMKLVDLEMMKADATKEHIELLKLQNAAMRDEELITGKIQKQASNEDVFNSRQDGESNGMNWRDYTILGQQGADVSRFKRDGKWVDTASTDPEEIRRRFGQSDEQRKALATTTGHSSSVPRTDGEMAELKRDFEKMANDRELMAQAMKTMAEVMQGDREAVQQTANDMQTQQARNTRIQSFQ